MYIWRREGTRDKRRNLIKGEDGWRPHTNKLFVNNLLTQLDNINNFYSDIINKRIQSTKYDHEEYSDNIELIPEFPFPILYKNITHPSLLEASTLHYQEFKFLTQSLTSLLTKLSHYLIQTSSGKEEINFLTDKINDHWISRKLNIGINNAICHDCRDTFLILRFLFLKHCIDEYGQIMCKDLSKLVENNDKNAYYRDESDSYSNSYHFFYHNPLIFVYHPDLHDFTDPLYDNYEHIDDEGDDPLWYVRDFPLRAGLSMKTLKNLLTELLYEDDQSEQRNEKKIESCMAFILSSGTTSNPNYLKQLRKEEQGVVKMIKNLNNNDEETGGVLISFTNFVLLLLKFFQNFNLRNFMNNIGLKKSFSSKKSKKSKDKKNPQSYLEEIVNQMSSSKNSKFNIVNLKSIAYLFDNVNTKFKKSIQKAIAHELTIYHTYSNTYYLALKEFRIAHPITNFTIVNTDVSILNKTNTLISHITNSIFTNHYMVITKNKIDVNPKEFKLGQDAGGEEDFKVSNSIIPLFCDQCHQRFPDLYSYYYHKLISSSFIHHIRQQREIAVAPYLNLITDLFRDHNPNVRKWKAQRLMFAKELGSMEVRTELVQPESLRPNLLDKNGKRLEQMMNGAFVTGFDPTTGIRPPPQQIMRHKLPNLFAAQDLNKNQKNLISIITSYCYNTSSFNTRRSSYRSDMPPLLTSEDNQSIHHIHAINPNETHNALVNNSKEFAMKLLRNWQESLGLENSMNPYSNVDDINFFEDARNIVMKSPLRRTILDILRAQGNFIDTVPTDVTYLLIKNNNDEENEEDELKDSNPLALVDPRLGGITKDKLTYSTKLTQKVKKEKSLSAIVKFEFDPILDIEGASEFLRDKNHDIHKMYLDSLEEIKKNEILVKHGKIKPHELKKMNKLKKSEEEFKKKFPESVAKSKFSDGIFIIGEFNGWIPELLESSTKILLSNPDMNNPSNGVILPGKPFILKQLGAGRYKYRYIFQHKELVNPQATIVVDNTSPIGLSNEIYVTTNENVKDISLFKYSNNVNNKEKFIDPLPNNVKLLTHLENDDHSNVIITSKMDSDLNGNLNSSLYHITNYEQELITRRLYSINLEKNNLYDHGIITLFSTITHPLTLTRELRLSYNQITDYGTFTLANSLTLLPSLVLLSLNGNGITNFGMLALVAGLKKALKAKADAEKLKKIQEREKISKNKNYLDNPSISSISLLSSPYEKSLIWLAHLELSGNLIGDDGCETISKYLTFNTHLITLNLNNCLITNHGIHHLSKALLHNNFLRALYLSGNSIRAFGAYKLSVALSNNASIKEIDLSVNPLGADGCKFIGNAIGNSASLSHINLGHCGLLVSSRFLEGGEMLINNLNKVSKVNIRVKNPFHIIIADPSKKSKYNLYNDNSGIYSIAFGIKKSKSLLRRISLENNKLDSNHLAILTNSMIFNYTLLEVNVENNLITDEWFLPEKYIYCSMNPKTPSLRTILDRNRGKHKLLISDQKILQKMRNIVPRNPGESLNIDPKAYQKNTMEFDEFGRPLNGDLKDYQYLYRDPKSLLGTVDECSNYYKYLELDELQEVLDPYEVKNKFENSENKKYKFYLEEFSYKDSYDFINNNNSSIINDDLNQLNLEEETLQQKTFLSHESDFSSRQLNRHHVKQSKIQSLLDRIKEIKYGKWDANQNWKPLIRTLAQKRKNRLKYIKESLAIQREEKFVNDNTKSSLQSLLVYLNTPSASDYINEINKYLTQYLQDISKFNIDWLPFLKIHDNSPSLNSFSKLLHFLSLEIPLENSYYDTQTESYAPLININNDLINFLDPWSNLIRNQQVDEKNNPLKSTNSKVKFEFAFNCLKLFLSIHISIITSIFSLVSVKDPLVKQESKSNFLNFFKSKNKNENDYSSDFYNNKFIPFTAYDVHPQHVQLVLHRLSFSIEDQKTLQHCIDNTIIHTNQVEISDDKYLTQEEEDKIYNKSKHIIGLHKFIIYILQYSKFLASTSSIRSTNNSFFKNNFKRIRILTDLYFNPPSEEAKRLLLLSHEYYFLRHFRNQFRSLSYPSLTHTVNKKEKSTIVIPKYQKRVLNTRENRKEARIQRIKSFMKINNSNKLNINKYKNIIKYNEKDGTKNYEKIEFDEDEDGENDDDENDVLMRNQFLPPAPHFFQMPQTIQQQNQTNLIKPPSQPKHVCLYCQQRFPNEVSLNKHLNQSDSISEWNNFYHKKLFLLKKVNESFLYFLNFIKMKIINVKFPAYFLFYPESKLTEEFVAHVMDQIGPQGRPLAVLELNRTVLVQDMIGEYFKVKISESISGFVKYRTGNWKFLYPMKDFQQENQENYYIRQSYHKAYYLKNFLNYENEKLEDKLMININKKNLKLKKLIAKNYFHNYLEVTNKIQNVLEIPPKISSSISYFRVNDRLPKDISLKVRYSPFLDDELYKKDETVDDGVVNNKASQLNYKEKSNDPSLVASNIIGHLGQNDVVKVIGVFPDWLQIIYKEEHVAWVRKTIPLENNNRNQEKNLLKHEDDIISFNNSKNNGDRFLQYLQSELKLVVDKKIKKINNSEFKIDEKILNDFYSYIKEDDEKFNDEYFDMFEENELQMQDQLYKDDIATYNINGQNYHVNLRLNPHVSRYKIAMLDAFCHGSQILSSQNHLLVRIPDCIIHTFIEDEMINVSGNKELFNDDGEEEDEEDEDQFIEEKEESSNQNKILFEPVSNNNNSVVNVENNSYPLNSTKLKNSVKNTLKKKYNKMNLKLIDLKSPFVLTQKNLFDLTFRQDEYTLRYFQYVESDFYNKKNNFFNFNDKENDKENESSLYQEELWTDFDLIYNDYKEEIHEESDDESENENENDQKDVLEEDEETLEENQLPNNRRRKRRRGLKK